jgi:signal transduction histidine kinase
MPATSPAARLPPATCLAEWVELCPDATACFDAQGRWRHANAAFSALLRLPADAESYRSLTGLSQTLAQLAHPAQPAVTDLTQAALAGPDAAPWRLPLADGRTLLLRVRRGAQGERYVWLQDVTHEVEVDRMKSEFLSTAAHELRNPMASIHGFAELLLTRSLKPERLREVAEILHRQTTGLVRMVNELLDLARIEARRGTDLAPERLTLARLGADALAGLSGARAGATEHAVDLHRVQVLWHAPEDATIADPAKASRALGNVLSNALKYSPADRPVQLRSERCHEAGRDWLMLTVTDQGRGMSPDEQARAFERFYRAEPHSDIPGTGLGLSLVKEIMGVLGGRVALHSALGEGTTVNLAFPAEPLAASAGAEPAVSRGAGKPRRPRVRKVSTG